MIIAAMKKRVSILGCGWLGKALAIDLVANGASVKGSTTTKCKLTELESLGIQAYQIDIGEPSINTDFLTSDVLVISITSKNVQDFERLRTEIEKSTIKKVIFISSTSVYPNLNRLVNEKDEIKASPLIDIEASIRASTHYHWNILRFAGLLGYDRHPSNWFKNRSIPNPEGFVNMIHRDDCVEIIKKLILEKHPNQIFNACSNDHPTRRDFYTYAKLSRGMQPPQFLEGTQQPSWKKISSQKLQNSLSYQFKFDNLLKI